jgi:hypothetical protein
LARTIDPFAKSQPIIHTQKQVTYAAAFLLAVLVALCGMAVWFATSFAVRGIDQTRYRDVAAEAARSGVLAAIYRLPLAPDKEFYLHGGDDCLTLSMLIAPQESRLKAAISPRVPVGQFQIGADAREGFPPHPYCEGLAAMLQALKGPGDRTSSLPEMIYYHRYIHGTVTIAALLLSILSFATATTLLLAACYALLAWLIIAAALRLRSTSPAERRRAGAFLAIGLALALFYALPLFDRSFCFAPLDITIIGFILFGLFQPLGRISGIGLVLAAASLATAVTIFDRLVGGIPTALAILIVLIVLGEAQDRQTFIRRLALALVAFIAGVAVCVVCKQLIVLATWGPDALADFASRLGQRTGGGVTEELSDSIKQRLHDVGLSLSWLDSSFFSRVVFAGIMLTYSAFVLGWGSHVLGAAIVILPIPLLLLLMYFAMRGCPLQSWPLELLAIVGAAMIPFAWYLVFLNLTILHSSFVVRPLALTAALTAVMVLRATNDDRADRGAQG